MFYYHLHTWLMKTSFIEKNAKELTDLQVEQIKELVELLGDPMHVPQVLLQSAIEVAHINGGARELRDYADHLRTTADTIERRIRRNNMRTVSSIGDPVNQD